MTRPTPPLGQVLVRTLNHGTCDVYSPKAFETLIHENVTHIVFFIVYEINLGLGNSSEFLGFFIVTAFSQTDLFLV